tara:strand:+ start:8705 stop:10387 length:1683 start_codon:yes stop_codon:yes gene_type:complete
MKFKITPLTIIIFLLLILVLLIILNNSSFFSREGFVSFLQSENTATQNSIPQYGQDKVFKLYDNLFFDNRNGTLIEVDSPTYTDSADLTGETITSLTTLPRDSNVSFTYSISSSEQRIEEQPKKLSPSKKTLIYESMSENTDNYLVFYMPWDKKTFLHVLNITNEPVTNEASYYFNDTSVSYNKMQNSSELVVTDFQLDDAEDNNKDVLEPLYNSNREVHQISKYTLFDKKNGNIIIKSSSDNSIDIYKRGSSDKITANSSEEQQETSFGDNDSFENIDFSVNMYEDSNGGNTLLSMSHGVDTVLALIGKNEAGEVIIKNLKHVKPNENKESLKTKKNKKDKKHEEEEEENNHDVSKQEDSEFNMHDYILKTQIVPPVCPSCPTCPACPNDVTCNNCGGSGGSGTLSKDGNSNVERDIISKTTSAVGDTAKGAVGAVGDVAGGAVGAVGDVAGGAVGAAGDVASGAVGAAGGVVSSAIGAVGDVASSAIGAVGKLGQSGENNNQQMSLNQQQSNSIPQSSIPQTNTVSAATDPYSYYGQLPNKQPSNYMPITASFSSFGK